MIVCVLLPRFALVIAAGGREVLARGPAALAPEPGREQKVGEISPAAEAFGVHAGMRLGEALARRHGGGGGSDPAALLRARTAGGPPPWLEGVVGATRTALRLPARIGAGPSRFCALAGAARARSRRAELVDGGPALAGEPVALLRHRPEVERLADPLQRLGIATLGALAALPRASVVDRFGRPGELAQDLARGRDSALVPRRPGETLEEVLELPESAS